MIDGQTDSDINADSEEMSVRAALEAAWDSQVADETPAATDPNAAPPQTEAKPAAIDDRSAGERARDDKGRFAAAAPPAAEAAPITAQPVAAQQPAQAQEQVTEPAAETIAARPPPGWSVASKAAWDALPPHIRADVAKREAEVSEGFKSYQGLKPFADMAIRSGTTLDKALNNYVGMENALRSDFKGGMLRIAEGMGVSAQQLQQMFGGAAQAQPQTQPNPSEADAGYSDDPYIQQAIKAALRPYEEKLGAVESQFQSQMQAHSASKLQAAEKVIESFRASDEYRYYSDVEGEINYILRATDETGRPLLARTGDFKADLATAYHKACQLNDEVREALFNERISKADQERQALATNAEAEKRAKLGSAQRAAISVRGAPSGPVSAPAGSKGSVRADLEAAWDAHT